MNSLNIAWGLIIGLCLLGVVVIFWYEKTLANMRGKMAIKEANFKKAVDALEAENSIRKESYKKLLDKTEELHKRAVDMLQTPSKL